MKPIHERFQELTSMVNVVNTKPSEIVNQMRLLTDSTNADERIEMSDKLWKLHFIKALPFNIQTKIKTISQNLSFDQTVIEADKFFSELPCESKIIYMEKQLEPNKNVSALSSIKEFFYINKLLKNTNKKVDKDETSENKILNNTFYNKYLTSLKILIVGESFVGKSSLLKRYVENIFIDKYQTTVGVDFCNKEITIDNDTVNLAIWDTAGLEKFRALPPNFFRNAHGVIFVYDITQKSTFEKLESWLITVNENVDNHNIVKVLVGNKIDLKNRVVSRREGVRWANVNKMTFIEASAKTNEQVESIFEDLAETIIKTPNLWEPLSKKTDFFSTNSEQKSFCC